ncbi:MAG: hypothetical protein JSU95_04375, partial [Betaproteobacteria bacterium]
MDNTRMWHRPDGAQFYLLIIFFLFASSPVAAQIEFSRHVNYIVNVEPQVLILDRTEEFRPDSPIGKASIVLVPDRKIEAKNDDDRRGLAALSQMVAILSGTYPRQSEI